MSLIHRRERYSSDLQDAVILAILNKNNFIFPAELIFLSDLPGGADS